MVRHINSVIYVPAKIELYIYWKKQNKKEMFKEQRKIRRMSHYSILKWETLGRWIKPRRWDVGELNIASFVKNDSQSQKLR